MSVQPVSNEQRQHAVSAFGRTLAGILDIQHDIDGVVHWPSIGHALQERRNNLPDVRQVQNFNMCTSMMAKAFESWSVANRIYCLQLRDPNAFITLTPFWKETMFTHTTHFKAKVKTHRFGGLGYQIFSVIKASLLSWLYTCDAEMSKLHDDDLQTEGVDYVPLDPIEPTAAELKLLTDTNTSSQRHAFHSTMRGIAHLLTARIVMDPREVERQLAGAETSQQTADAVSPQTETDQSRPSRAQLPPRITSIRDANTFCELGQRLLVNTTFETIELFHAQIVLITHLRTLCRDLTSEKATAILRVKFDDIAAEVAHPSPEFAHELAKEEGVLGDSNLGLHRKWLATSLRAAPEDRLERVTSYMEMYAERLRKVCHRTVKAMEAWQIPFSDSLPNMVLVCCDAKPEAHEVPYCSAVARRRHMAFYVPDKAVRKRHRADAYTLRLVRICTMLVTMVKAQCFYEGCFPVRAVRSVARQECDVADCVYKLCMLHIQNFWGTGMELVSAMSAVSDPSSEVADAVDDAIVALSGVSTLHLEGLFNVRRPTFYGIRDELHEAIHANLIHKIARGYHAVGSDIGPIVLKRIKRRRSMVSWLPHETRDPLVEALWRHPAVRAWVRAGGARVRQLRIAANEVSAKSVGGRAVLELVASAPSMIKYNRAYDPSTRKKSAAKTYNFDSLLVARFLKLAI